MLTDAEISAQIKIHKIPRPDPRPSFWSTLHQISFKLELESRLTRLICRKFTEKRECKTKNSLNVST